MRKSMIRLSIAAALLLPVAAIAEGSYVKLGIGKSTYDYNVDFLPNDHPTGYLLAYGMSLDPTWGVEGGLVSFGSVDTNDGTGSKLRVDALYAAGTASYPINPQAAIYGKLGLAAQRGSSAGRSSTHSSWVLGAGARWNFSPEWGAALEYTHFTKTEGVTLSQTTISAIYNF